MYWGCAAVKGVFTVSVWEGCYLQPNRLAQLRPRVRFSLLLSGKGVVFRPNSLARGGFLESRFDTEILARVVSLTFFVWEEWEIFVWERVRVCHPGLP